MVICLKCDEIPELLRDGRAKCAVCAIVSQNDGTNVPNSPAAPDPSFAEMDTCARSQQDTALLYLALQEAK